MQKYVQLFTRVRSEPLSARNEQKTPVRGRDTRGGTGSGSRDTQMTDVQKMCTHGHSHGSVSGDMKDHDDEKVSVEQDMHTLMHGSRAGGRIFDQEKAFGVCARGHNAQSGDVSAQQDGDEAAHASRFGNSSNEQELSSTALACREASQRIQELGRSISRETATAPHGNTIATNRQKRKRKPNRRTQSHGAPSTSEKHGAAHHRMYKKPKKMPKTQQASPAHNGHQVRDGNNTNTTDSPSLSSALLLASLKHSMSPELAKNVPVAQKDVTRKMNGAHSTSESQMPVFGQQDPGADPSSCTESDGNHSSASSSYNGAHNTKLTSESSCESDSPTSSVDFVYGKTLVDSQGGTSGTQGHVYRTSNHKLPQTTVAPKSQKNRVTQKPIDAAQKSSKPNDERRSLKMGVAELLRVARDARDGRSSSSPLTRRQCQNRRPVAATATSQIAGDSNGARTRAPHTAAHSQARTNTPAVQGRGKPLLDVASRLSPEAPPPRITPRTLAVITASGSVSPSVSPTETTTAATRPATDARTDPAHQAIADDRSQATARTDPAPPRATRTPPPPPRALAPAAPPKAIAGRTAPAASALDLNAISAPKGDTRTRATSPALALSNGRKNIRGSDIAHSKSGGRSAQVLHSQNTPHNTNSSNNAQSLSSKGNSHLPKEMVSQKTSSQTQPNGMALRAHSNFVKKTRASAKPRVHQPMSLTTKKDTSCRSIAAGQTTANPKKKTYLVSASCAKVTADTPVFVVEGCNNVKASSNDFIVAAKECVKNVDDQPQALRRTAKGVAVVVFPTVNGRPNPESAFL